MNKSSLRNVVVADLMGGRITSTEAVCFLRNVPCEKQELDELDRLLTEIALAAYVVGNISVQRLLYELDAVHASDLRSRRIKAGKE